MPRTKAEILASLDRYERRIKRVIPGIVNGSSQPIPEFVDRKVRPWKVTKAIGLEGSTDIKGATLVVPFGKAKFARSTRIEELMHARHSTGPKSEAICRRIYAKEARRTLIQGAEDYRVKTIAREGAFYGDKALVQGETQLAKLANRSMLRNAPQPMALIRGGCPYPFEDMAYLYLATLKGTPKASHLFNQMITEYCIVNSLTADESEMFISFLYDLESAIRTTAYGPKCRKRKVYTPDKYHPWTMQIAKAAEKVVRMYEAKAKTHSPYAAKEESSDKKERKEVLPNPPMDKNETPEEARFRVASGNMEVHLPPLHRRLLFSIKTRTSAAIGPILHRIENLTIDAVAPPIFAIRASKANRCPVVLLDASGSMGINAPNVEELIKLAPGCIVYFYNGNDCDHGDLVRVSANGRFCERSKFEEKAAQSGNTVDYLALKYCLTKHAGHPMHWVTDKGYTWYRPYGSTINAHLTAYAQKKGVIFHEHINEFGIYAKKHKMGMKA